MGSPFRAAERRRTRTRGNRRPPRHERPRFPSRAAVVAAGRGGGGDAGARRLELLGRAEIVGAAAACWPALRLVVLAAVCSSSRSRRNRRQEVTILRPQVAVLVDDSASMNDPVDDAQPRRAERVKEFLDSPAVRAGAQDVRFPRVQPRRQTELPADQRARRLQRQRIEHRQRRWASWWSISRGSRWRRCSCSRTGWTRAASPGRKRRRYSVPVDTFELEKPFTPKPREQRISIAGRGLSRRAWSIGWHSDIHLSIAGSGVSGKAVPVELWRGGPEGRRRRRRRSTRTNRRGRSRSQFTHERAGVDQFEVRVHGRGGRQGGAGVPVFHRRGGTGQARALRAEPTLVRLQVPAQGHRVQPQPATRLVHALGGRPARQPGRPAAARPRRWISRRAGWRTTPS